MKIADFPDIRDRMHAHREAMHVFLFTVGATLIQCQAFEDRLRQFKTLVFGHREEMTREQFDAMLAQSRKEDTLGSILKDLKKKTRVEQKTQELLDEFLTERNWFIHHLEYQHGSDTFDPAALPPVLERLRNLQIRSTHLQNQFAELTSSWVQQHRGVPKEAIDAETWKLLSKSIKPPTTG